MEIINPRITIDKTDAFFWIVRLEQRLSEVEHIDIRLKVKRACFTLGDLQTQVLTQARDLLSQMLDYGTPRTPDAPPGP